MTSRFRTLARSLLGRSPRKDRSTAPISPPAAALGGPRTQGDWRWSFDEFFVLRNALFVRGWVYHTSGESVAAELKLPDGTRSPMTFQREPRLDLVDIFGAEARDSGFRAAYLFAAEPGSEEVSRVRVVLRAGDSELQVDDPVGARFKSDAFNQSEDFFWDHVRKNPTGNVLEIGSRARSGIVRRQLFPPECNYVGLDYLAGVNVDVVGDAHAMSSLLPREHFDFVFSGAVFEHLAMPWKVALEMNQVMKIGGVAMIATVQTWPVHEAPWDYFRFSDYAWDALFNEASGFQIVARGMGWPCVTASALFRPDLHDSRLDLSPGYLATRCVAKKIGPTRLEWPVPTAMVSQGHYPF